MVCSYHSSCIDLPVALVDFQVEGCPLRWTMFVRGGMWFRIILILTERRRIFVAIMLTRYGAGASQRHWRRWDTALCTGQMNQRRKNKKWKGQYLEVVVMRSVSYLLFIPMERSVSHHLVLFLLLVNHLNLLILLFLSILEYTVLKSITIRRGGGSENKSIHWKRRLGKRRRGSKWVWQYKQSLLLVIGSWYPWNQDLITHHSSTKPQLPRS